MSVRVLKSSLRARRSFTMRSAAPSASRKLCAVTPGGFKYRQQIGKPQQMPDWFAVIDEDEITACFPGRDVQTDERAESCTVHVGDFIEVEDDPSFVRDQALHMILQTFCVLDRQLARTLHDHLVFSSGSL